MQETLTDDRLAEMAKHDADAFATLYRRHLHRVYSYLLSRTGSVQDAQDLTAQTFVAALNSMDTYEPQGKFVAWLLGIAKRKLSDHFRGTIPTVSIENAEPLSDGHDMPEDFIIKQLGMEEIANVLTKLNPERAEAIRLRYFAGLKMQEVADSMGKSEGAVKMLVARGLDDMRQILVIQEEIS